MKLNDLVTASPAKHYTKILESYFGHRVSIEDIDARSAKRLLGRVRSLIAECRSGKSAHFSERDPKFLQLMVVEQALVQRLTENTTQPTSTVAGAAVQPAASITPADMQKFKAQQMQAVQKIKDPKLQQTMKKSVGGQTLSKDEQQTMASAVMGSPVKEEATGTRYAKWPTQKLQKFWNQHKDEERPAPALASELRAVAKELRTRKKANESWNRQWRALNESEVQQAQVILAAQDLVDRVQKMIEECTSVQFKDLPALVNQIKNEIGYDQAVQFNTDASAALSTLVQSMQGSKQQLESAVGVVTGQQNSTPMPQAADLNPPAGPVAGEEQMDFDMNMDFEEPAVGGDEATFGRKRVSESARKARHSRR